MFEVRQFVARDGFNPYMDWLRKLRDTKGKISVVRRVSRLESGNFGDHKSVGGGVWELKIDAGPGYRVYYAQAGKVLLLLLCGGDKSTQQRDIQNAKAAWHDWQARQHEDGALT
jgi:putative addiction module killer protein